MTNKLLCISFLLVFLLGCLRVEAKSLELIRQDPLPASKIPLRRAEASSSGVVPFSWPTFAVNVDFTDLSGILPTPGGDQQTGTMGIALYTNESFFGGDCSNFLQYDCSEPDCSTDPSYVRNISYPYFTLKGYSLHTQLFMDYDFFSSTYMGFIYAQSCYPNYTTNKNAVYGYIGLGLDGYSFNNFVGSFPTFSVYLDKNGVKGSLIFDCDTTKINQTGYNKAVLTTKNWEITFRDLNLNQFVISYSGTVIFDLNFPYIGVPEAIYTELVSALKTTYGVVCYDPDIFLLGCVYLGDYLKLPPIEVGNQLQIPAETYLHVISAKQNTYALMLIPLTTEDSPDVYAVTVMPNYQHHIILGAPFFQSFYTCFETKPKGFQISIHQKREDLDYDQNIMKWIYVGLSVGIPSLLFCFFMCASCWRKGKTQPKDLNAPLAQQDGVQGGPSLKNINDSKSSDPPLIYEKMATNFRNNKNGENFSFAGSLLKKQNSI